jgi:hypothetical protein
VINIIDSQSAEKSSADEDRSGSGGAEAATSHPFERIAEKSI